VKQGFRPEVVVLPSFVGQRSLEVEVEPSVRQEAGWGRAESGVSLGGGPGKEEYRRERLRRQESISSSMRRPGTWRTVRSEE
jgi:hypothetical protein